MTENIHHVTFEEALHHFEQEDYDVCLHLLEDLRKEKLNDETFLHNVHMMLGHTHFELEDFVLSQQHYDSCIKIRPSHMAYHKLGHVWRDLQQYEQSVHCFHKAIEFDNDIIFDYMGIAHTYKCMYEFDKALQYYKKVIALNPSYTKAYRNMVSCKTYTSVDDPEIQTLQALIKDKSLSDEELEQCYFALGKMMSDCGANAKAFQYYEKGNKLRGAYRPFKHAKHQSKIFNQIKTFNKPFFEQLGEAGNPSTQPIFIVGLTRSGKTLIERIICESGQAYPREETAILNRMLNLEAPKMESNHFEQEILEFLSTERIRALSHRYLEQLVLADTSAQFFTDTTPCNYRYLGFIKTLFPKAKVIFCKRHPLDQCLQIYFKYFNRGHYFTYDLKTLGQYYALYLDIMTHWQSIYGNNLLTVSYEQIIKNPESTTHQILEHVGLEPRPLHLALTDKEMGLWQLYEKQLKPIKRSLKHYLKDWE